MPMSYVDGSGTNGSGTIPAPLKKLGGGAVKPRPKEGKLWPVGLVKQDK